MRKQKLGINLIRKFTETNGEAETLRSIKNAGFDAVFTLYEGRERMKEQAEAVREAGLIYQSQHMTWQKDALLWEDPGDAGEEAANEHIDCIRASAENGVPLMIAHVIIGMERCTPTPLGIERFGRIIREAEKEGVTIGFENTEGEVYLDAVLKEFQGSPAVAFCYDSGHELCYNHSADMLGRYGHLLAGTHLNDNLGISDPEGKITWKDDLHLLPFDGIADWTEITRRLARSRPVDILTLEVLPVSKPGRHDNDRYAALTADEYYALAFSKACRIAAMTEREKGN